MSVHVPTYDETFKMLPTIDNYESESVYFVVCSKDNPAASCQEIYTKDAGSVSGAYWIKGKAEPFQVSSDQSFCAKQNITPSR